MKISIKHIYFFIFIFMADLSKNAEKVLELVEGLTIVELAELRLIHLVERDTAWDKANIAARQDNARSKPSRYLDRRHKVFDCRISRLVHVFVYDCHQRPEHFMVREIPRASDFHRYGVAVLDFSQRLQAKIINRPQ